MEDVEYYVTNVFSKTHVEHISPSDSNRVVVVSLHTAAWISSEVTNPDLESTLAALVAAICKCRRSARRSALPSSSPG